MDVLVKRLVGANRIPAVHSPLIPPLHKLGRWESGEALNAFEPTENTDVGVWEMPLARAALFLLFVGLTLSVQAGVREVGAIGLTVGDLDRELVFYTNTLPFELVSISEVSNREQDALLGLSDVKLRVANLKLGDERITLMEHLVNKGRPIAADSQSYDHWFQHIAIVVSDTDKSLAFYRDLLGLRVAGESENFGVEQEHLNQVFGARLRITALRAEKGPGIEFLEYISPPGGRALPENAKANDLIFWHTDLLADEINGLASRLHHRGTRFVTAPSVRLRGDSSDSLDRVMLRDPDGHALELIRRADPALSTVVPSGNRLSNR